MRKPILIKIELLQNFKSKDDKNLLLSLGNQNKSYKNSNEAKKDLNVETANEAFEILRNMYNKDVIESNKRFKTLYDVKNKEYKEYLNKKDFKNLPNVKVSNNQITKEKRKENYEKYTSLVQKETKVIDKKRSFDRQELKALGAFQQITFNVNENKEINLTDIKTIITNELSKAFYTKQTDTNLFSNIFISYLKEKEGDEQVFHFQGQFAENLKSIKYIDDFVNNFIQDLQENIESFNKNGSGWVFIKFKQICIQLSKKNIVKGGSYIPTPKDIENKKCCVNIKNEDDECFKWAILSSFHYEDIGKITNRTNPKYYEKYKDDIIEPKDITYPIDIFKDIPKFEKLNNFKINVFGYENNKSFVIYNSRNRSDVVIDLLLLKEENKNHFIWIKNFSRFIVPNGKCKNKLYCCRQCLNAHYNSQEHLDKHIVECMKYEAVKVVLPDEKDKLIKFKNYNHTFKHPFYISVDFEATLEEYQEEVIDGKETYKYQKHTPNSYGIKFNCIYSEYNKNIIIENNKDPEELMKSFIENLEVLTHYAYSLTQKHKKFGNYSYFNETSEGLIHKVSKTCEYCKSGFDEKKLQVFKS